MRVGKGRELSPTKLVLQDTCMPINPFWWFNGSIFWLVRRTTESDVLHVGHGRGTTARRLMCPTSLRGQERALVGDRKCLPCVSEAKRHSSTRVVDSKTRIRNVVERIGTRIGDRRPFLANPSLAGQGHLRKNKKIFGAHALVSQDARHEDRTFRSAFGIFMLWVTERRVLRL